MREAMPAVPIAGLVMIEAALVLGSLKASPRSPAASSWRGDSSYSACTAAPAHVLTSNNGRYARLDAIGVAHTDARSSFLELPYYDPRRSYG